MSGPGSLPSWELEARAADRENLAASARQAGDPDAGQPRITHPNFSEGMRLNAWLMEAHWREVRRREADPGFS